MEERYLRLKIVEKQRERKYKIKKFPVYIGSGKADDIIPLAGDGISPRHGYFELKNDKLYYTDNSENGTKIYGRSINHSTIPLNIGSTEMQIGRFRVFVDNMWSIYQSDDLKKINKKREKMFIALFSSVGSLLVLGILLVVYLIFIRKMEINLSDFEISPVKISPYKSAFVQNIIYDVKEPVNTSKIKYMIYYEKNLKILDSAAIKFDSLGKSILPVKNLSNYVNIKNGEDSIKIILSAKSSFYKVIKDKITKNVIVTDKYLNFPLQKGGGVVSTNFSNNIISYNISSMKKIKDIEVNFGEDKKAKPIKIKENQIAPRSYSKPGKYTFNLKVYYEDKYLGADIISRELVVK